MNSYLSGKKTRPASSNITRTRQRTARGLQPWLAAECGRMGRPDAVSEFQRTLKVYPGAPHGMCSILKDLINEDLLAFLKS